MKLLKAKIDISAQFPGIQTLISYQTDLPGGK